MKKYKEQVCEANFFIGEWQLLRNRKQEARKLFTEAENDCPKNFMEYMASISELQRIK